MEQVLGIFFFVLCIVGVMWVSIIFTSFVQELSMRQSKLKRLDDNEPSGEAPAWAVANGFEFVGNFRLGPVYIAGWEHTKRPSFFCEYRIQRKEFFDMVTTFADDMSLTTGSTKDGQLNPKPPGDYFQTFSNLSLGQLWEKHVEGENYLVGKGGVKLPEIMLLFEDEITGALCKELEYHKSIPLYHFRVPFWFFFRRRRWHNKSIQAQHERGMIRLPNEMKNE
jgi:hypothetical protein